MSRTPWRGTTRRFAGVIALALVLPILPIGMQAASASSNNALQFNGTSQYARIGISPTNALQLSTFTLETWFMRTGTGGTMTTGAVTGIPLITKGRGEGETQESRDVNYFLGISTAGTGTTNVLAADFEEAASGSSPSSNHTIFGSTVIAQNVWYHAAATYDGTSWSLYLNGNLENSEVENAPPASLSTVAPAFGTSMSTASTVATPAPSGFLQGRMDEVRIWNTARSLAQIQGSMNSELTATSGLVGRWGMNEGNGTISTADSIGANPALFATTPAGAQPTWVAGAPGTDPAAPIANAALSLNGANQYVTMGTAPALGASQFTLEGWIKSTGPGLTASTGAGGLEDTSGTGGQNRTAVPLISKGRAQSDGSNLDMNYFLGLDPDASNNYRLVADFEDTATGLNHPVFNPTGTVIPPDSWTHVAATYDGNEWRLYVNGALEVAETEGATPRSDSIQHFGVGSAMTSTGAAAGFFQGSMDEVRVWNTARSQAQIQASMDREVVVAPGLVGRYGLNEGTGTTTSNSAGTALPGTLTGTPAANLPSWTAGPTFPFDNPSLLLNGSSQYATLGGVGDLRMSQFTLELWFQRTATGVGTNTGSGGVGDVIPLIAKGRAQDENQAMDINYIFGIDQSSGELVADFEEAQSGTTPGQNHPITGVTPIAADGVWHHAAATYDGSTWKLYLDGVLENEEDENEPVNAMNDATTTIGSALTTTNVASGFFAGAVDEVRIWNVARSSAQINATKTIEIASPTAGLVGRWGLNEGTGTTIADSVGAPPVNGALVPASLPTAGARWFEGFPISTPSNTPPTADVSLNDTTPATNDVLTATAVGDDLDDDPLTYTYEWKVEGVTQQTTSDAASTTDTFDLATTNFGDRGDEITVTVTADDGIATSTPTASSTDMATVQNSDPVVSSATIEQSSVQTDTILSVVVVSSDDDGDTPTYAYQWLNGGNPIGGETGATLDLGSPGNGDKGDEISVEVQADDQNGGISATVESDAVTVGNVAPTVSVSIDQAMVGTNGTLTTTVVSDDDDGDTLITSYEWLIGTTPIAGETGASLDLSQVGNGDEGDAISVRATVDDGSATASDTSASITVDNSPPSVDSASIDESSASTDDTLHTTVTTSDADGETVTLAYQWYADGNLIAGESGDSLDLSVAGNGDKGQEITVRVTADDGDEADDLLSAGLTVGNTEPTATVSLSDTSPGTNDVLTATATTADADDDTVSLSYEWKVDGLSVQTTTATSSLTDTLDLSVGGNGDNGDTITVTVTPNDGDADGDDATDTASVGNQAPVVDSVAIAPTTLRTLTLASTSVTGHDDDDDPITYAYQWTNGGVDIDGATDSTLDLSVAGNGDRGDSIAVRVTATDGSATSAPLTSATKIVGDSPGIVAFSYVPPVHLYTNDVLNIPGTFGDPDGDPTPTLTYEWRVDGVAVQSTSSLANDPAADFDLSEAGHGDAGQTVELYYAVNANPMGTVPVFSDVVENSGPSVDGATIDPASPRTNDSLTVVAGSTDVDGDTVTYDYQWKKNGADLAGETGDELDLSVLGNGDKGDEIAVALTPSDGTDQGPAFTTDPVTIVNTAPSATVSLSDTGPGTDDTLIATASRSDDDGDGVLLTYEWKVDGTTRQVTSGTASLSDSFDLSATDNGDNGQTVTVTVTPNDGDEDGAPAVDTATVGNAAPVITSATIDETAPRTNDTIHVSAAATDDDGDTVTFTYQWTNDGADIAGQTGSSLDLSLPGNGGKNHVMAVKVTAHDGNGGTSSEVTALGVTIANTPPVATVSLNTATPGTNQTLTATATKSDADGEVITLTYEWKVNGVTQQTITKTGLTDTFDLSLAGNGGEGDAISVTVTPDDSDALGDPVTANATVGNTAPVVDSVVIDQASALTNDTLTSTVVTSDPDGDAVTVTYQWLKNGNPIAGEVGTSLDLSVLNNGGRGDLIRVRVIADDGQATTVDTSTGVTIGNSAPTATVSLAPASPFTNDTVTATATKADADGNAVTLTFEWKVNGSTVQTTVGTAALTDTLDLSQPGNGDPGDEITVTVTPQDNANAGAPVTSNTATVSTVNGAPTAFGANLAVTKAAARTFTLSATDPENDTLTYTIVTPPSSGTLSAGTGANRTYTPAASFTGAVSFTFRVSDGSTNSNVATVNLTVAPKYKVTMTDSAFNPIASKPLQGGTVRFVNAGTSAKTIADLSGMGLFGASINPGTEYAFRFTAAGKYEYSCSCSGSTGRVAIPVKILPAAGGTSVVRTVTWAVEDPAAGYVFDVQIKRPGIPGWTNWRTGVTTLSDAFTPDAGSGTYKFKARLRNTSNNTHSLYSAAKAVSVS